MRKLSDYKKIAERIKLLEKENKKSPARDTVKGSSAEFPYTQRTFTIEGNEQEELERIRRRKKKIQEMKKELSNLDNFIEAVDDPTIYKILSARYRQGLSWNQVAQRMGGGNTEDGVRMAAKRYMKKYRPEESAGK